MFLGKILQPNASRVKIIKHLPKIYSMRCRQQHNRAMVMLDIVIYIKNYKCSWWVHCLSQKLETWIQTSLPNPTFYKNSAKLIDCLFHQQKAEHVTPLCHRTENSPPPVQRPQHHTHLLYLRNFSKVQLQNSLRMIQMY